MADFRLTSPPLAAAFSRSGSAWSPSTGAVVASGVPRFEGGGVMVEEGTVNLLLNPVMATTASWVASNSGALAVQTSSPGGVFPLGATSCVKATAVGTSSCHTTQALNLALNAIHTISAWVYVPGDVAAGKAIMAVWYNSGGWQTITSSVITERNQWVRKSITFTSHASVASHVMGVGGISAGTIGQFIYICLAQLEQKAYATSFINGTRAIESLTLPTAEILNATEGTVACWVKADDVKVGRNHGIITNGAYTGIGAFYFWITGTALQLFIGNGATTRNVMHPTNVANGWNHVAVTWSATEAVVYLNGVPFASPGVCLPSITPTMALFSGGADRMLNGVADDLILYKRARTSAEISQLRNNNPPADFSAYLPSDNSLGLYRPVEMIRFSRAPLRPACSLERLQARELTAVDVPIVHVSLATNDIMQLTLRLTAAELALLQFFFTNTVRGMSLPFLFTDSANVTRTVHFNQPRLQPREHAYDTYFVDVVLRVLS